MQLIKHVFIFLFVFAAYQMNASHLIVGEVTYEYLGGNKYEFLVSLYRDCRPPAEGGGSPEAIMDDDPLYVTIFNGTNFFSFDSIYSNQITIIPSQFENNCLNSGSNSCVNRIQFKFQIILPPSTNEYTILTQRCCLNAGITNVKNPGNIGSTIYNKIPPSIVGTNSSARFLNDVSTSLFCVGKKYTIEHSAIDSDGDSLSYEFCEIDLGGNGAGNPKPLITGGTIPVLLHPEYIPGYSSQYPMPGASINSTTGELTIQCNLQGSYLTGICVHEWRNGVKINTTKRAYTYTVQQCDFSTMAKMSCDSITQQGTSFQTCLSNCSDRTIAFHNKSKGAISYHWDFGVTATLDDTSNLAEPIFTFPDTGRYRIILYSYGATCIDSVVEYVNISNDELSVDFTIGGQFCTGDSIHFNATGSSSTNTIQTYVWNIMYQNWNTFLVGQSASSVFEFPGMYTVVGSAVNTKGCYASSSQQMTLSSLDVKAFGDTILPLNKETTIYATGADSYSWDYYTKSSPTLQHYSDLQQFKFYYGAENTYYFVVHGTNTDGCIGIDTIKIIVTNQGKLFAPNVFSPNGDNLNDEFRIYLDGYVFKSLKIFNRRGQQVFSSTDIQQGWDGTFKGQPAAMETYYWFAEVLNSNQEKVIVKGDLILMR